MSYSKKLNASSTKNTGLKLPLTKNQPFKNARNVVIQYLIIDWRYYYALRQKLNNTDF